VDEQFELLWRDADTIPISRYFYLRVDVPVSESQTAVHTIEYVTVAGHIYAAGRHLATGEDFDHATVRVGHVRRGVLEWSMLPPLLPEEVDELRLRDAFFRKYGADTPLDHEPTVFRVDRVESIDSVDAIDRVNGVDAEREASQELGIGLQRRP